MMSGTSLDGLDLAAVRFWEHEGLWNFELGAAETLPYPKEMADRLKASMEANGRDLRLLDLELGTYFGEIASKFIEENSLSPNLVASHGHTVFHQPEAGMTLQIGDGLAIRHATLCNVVSDFRTEDVLKGGQGAPLVPIGDLLLFPEYTYCLNLGGIANISIKDGEGGIVASDLCFANMALNHLANLVGLDYDRDGLLAAKGQVKEDLLEALEKTMTVKDSAFSLGKESFEMEFSQLINNENISLNDRLATCSEHIALSISRRVKKEREGGKMLVTGGGALNGHLVGRIKHHVGQHCEVVVPDMGLVNFKEALVFAFLGVLRITGRTNVLASVTGAESDSCTGTVHPHPRS